MSAQVRQLSGSGSGSGSGRLPVDADLFVGREAELATLAALLEDPHGRLLTLTGPPGIGKTRLAATLARAYAQEPGRHAAFVDLAPLRDADQVVPELARALDVDLPERIDPVDRVIAAVANRPVLVVLDNLEHVLASAPRLSQVLSACRMLRLVATSRERLRLSGERVFPVPPLAMPAQGDASDLAALAANPSVALLVDRAQRVRPEFALTRRNAAAVVAACLRLEGNPLALELAAARLRALAPEELASRLDRRMRLLADHARDIPARHRALRSAIAWSHDLLNAAEQSMFRRLSVFAGGWTIADAENVCAAPEDDALVLVESLLDKSLIERVRCDVETAEFGMLESLREYAAEQLELHGEAAQVQSRHRVHYAAMARQFEATIGLPEEKACIQLLSRHHRDLGAALDHCLAAGQREPAMWLASAIGWYGYTSGDLRSGNAAVERVLDQVEPGGTRDEASGDAQVAVLVAVGVLAFGRGDLDHAESMLVRALERSRTQADTRHATVAHAFLGHVARMGGRFEESRHQHQQAQLGFQGLDNAQGVAWTQQDLGLLARDRGDLDAAAALLRESLRAFRDLGYPWAAAWSAWGLGTVLCGQGRIDEAGLLLGEALSAYLDVDDPRGVAQCLEVLAQVACERASYEIAACLVGCASVQRDRSAAPPVAADRARMAVVEQELARSLGPDAAERARQAGRVLPVQRAGELAAEVARGHAPADPHRQPPTILTRRERQVAALVASGRTNRQIGKVLGITEKTAETHLYHAMVKLSARSRAEVAAWATSHDLRD